MKTVKNSKDIVKVWATAVSLVFIGFYVAYQFVGPAPTDNIIIATGGKSGAYYQFGLKYADQFKKDGVELTVLETAGSIDNLSQLAKDGTNVHAALIQGGVGVPEDFPILESLGSLYYEPLWLFHSKKFEVKTLGDLKNKRIVLGQRGSGTYALSTQLLSENEVSPERAQFMEVGGSEGSDALISGKADALFVVGGISSENVRRLLENSNVVLYSFHRADAYVLKFKFLSRVILPEGSVNLTRNIPDRDITLVAPTANLVIRNDLHPALMYLFMIAADEVHRHGGLLEKRSAFPNPLAVGFPLNKEARRFYQSGPPFLMRVLPYRLATWLVRMFVMVIPIVTILYPLLKIAQPTYSWRIRRKVNKLYKQLYQLELEITEARDKDGLEQLNYRLITLKQKAISIHLPASHIVYQYRLRRHIDLLQQKLNQAKLDASNSDLPNQLN